MFRRILVSTDGSESARHALEKAAQLARLAGAELIAVHVVAPPVAEVSYMGLGVIGTPVSVGVADKPVAPAEDGALAQAQRVAEAAGIAIDSRQVLAPQAAGAILDLAERERCDLIVMTASGYGDLLSLVTGNVTARVVSGCRLPVLVVH